MQPIAPCRLRHIARGAAVLASFLGLALAAPPFARADFSVHMPDVNKGEREVEAAYTLSHDSKKELDGEAVYNLAVGYGVTGWWLTELEGEWTKPRDGKSQMDEVAWENTFQLLEPGQYWLNLGWFAEYAWPQHSGEHPDVKTGPILQVELGHSVHTANLFFERQVGSGAETTVELTYAWQSRFQVSEKMDAGLEIFGSPGEAGKPLPADQQDVRVGPVLYGEFKPSRETAFKYELGYLFGATKATPHGTWKVNVEFEF